MDLVYIGACALFFVTMLGMVIGCDTLGVHK